MWRKRRGKSAHLSAEVMADWRVDEDFAFFGAVDSETNAR